MNARKLYAIIQKIAHSDSISSGVYEQSIEELYNVFNEANNQRFTEVSALKHIIRDLVNLVEHSGDYCNCKLCEDKFREYFGSLLPKKENFKYQDLLK